MKSYRITVNGNVYDVSTNEFIERKKVFVDGKKQHSIIDMKCYHNLTNILNVL